MFSDLSVEVYTAGPNHQCFTSINSVHEKKKKKKKLLTKQIQIPDLSSNTTIEDALISLLKVSWCQTLGLDMLFMDKSG